MFHAIASVRVFVDDLVEARRFYAGVLQLPQAGGAPEQGFVQFGFGATTLLLEVGAAAAAAGEEPADADGALVGRFTGVSLATADIHATQAQLRARQVTLLGPPEQQPWGGWLLHFCDPAGNVLTAVQYPQDG